MIVDDVRIHEYQTTIGHQHEESYITCYGIQIHVFDKWWVMYGDDNQDLQKAIKMRDNLLGIIKGRC